MEPTEAARLREILARFQIDTTPPGGAKTATRLESSDDATLQVLVLDDHSSSADRQRALAILAERHRIDTELSGLLARLFDDRDPALIRAAIRAAPPFDATLTMRLHGLLCDSREAVWREAAWVLVRRKDLAVNSTVLSWLRTSDGPRFRFALEALAWIAASEDQVELLRSLEGRADRPDEDREALAEALRGLVGDAPAGD
jgi:hypothetical protein